MIGGPALQLHVKIKYGMSVVFYDKVYMSVFIETVRIWISAGKIGKTDFFAPGLHIVVGNPEFQRKSKSPAAIFNTGIIWGVYKGYTSSVKVYESGFVCRIGNISLVLLSPGFSAVRRVASVKPAAAAFSHIFLGTLPILLS